MSLDLLGLPKSWHSYQDFVNGRDNYPNWERLWSDLVQEKFRRNTSDGSSYRTDDEENCAFAGKAKKGKGNKSYSKSKTTEEGKEDDMSIVKFVHYHKHGHYATNFPQRRRTRRLQDLQLVRLWPCNLSWTSC